MPGEGRFPRSERLKKKTEFEHVYRYGKKSVNKAFICYTVRREGQGRKFGLAVSRKVGNAVVRNRVKRYIREAYRTSRTRLISECDVVIIARPYAATLNSRECADAIGQLFHLGGAIRD